ncbi:MAG: hypothetical protein NTX50_24175 [Candidatus Sumerlaeota bacterium]|nr:hypothetical protein [Candidatus Sumerlaeota bacterium]
MGRAKVTWIGAFIILISLVECMIEVSQFEGSGPGNAIRFTATLFLCIAMMCGINWARWLIAIGCGLGGLIGLNILRFLVDHEISIISPVGGWIIFFSVINFAFVGILIFSTDVSRYYVCL